jgi:hypothetical protein
MKPGIGRNKDWMEQGKALASAALRPPVEGILSREECPIRQGKFCTARDEIWAGGHTESFSKATGRRPARGDKAANQSSEANFRLIGGAQKSAGKPLSGNRSQAA